MGLPKGIWGGADSTEGPKRQEGTTPCLRSCGCEGLTPAVHYRAAGGHLGLRVRPELCSVGRPMRFKGKVAIVTGAAQGIGVGIARVFAQEGAAVTIADIDVAKGRLTAREIRRPEKAPILFVRTDVSKAGQVQAMVDKTIARFGAIDVLVNNAAVIDFAHMLEFTEASWDRIQDVNLKGPFLCSQAVARHWVAQGKAGSIINITSVGSPRGARTENASYHASKGGLHSLTQAMAMDLAPYGIRVNAIGPAGVPSMLSVPKGASPGGSPEGRSLQNVDTIPLGRLATAEEMGRVVAFLASDDAAYMTGQHFYVDGGRTAKL